MTVHKNRRVRDRPSQNWQFCESRLRKLPPSKFLHLVSASSCVARRRWRLEVVKHFILSRFYVAIVPQPRVPRRSAPLKFEQNFIILALSSCRQRQTHQKRAHGCEILVSNDMPSFASNGALCHHMVPFLVFAVFARVPELWNFPKIHVFSNV